MAPVGDDRSPGGGGGAHARRPPAAKKPRPPESRQCIDEVAGGRREAVPCRAVFSTDIRCRCAVGRNMIQSGIRRRR